MIRKLPELIQRALLTALFALILLMLTAGLAKAAPQFKSPVLVSGNHVTLGDILTEVGSSANIIVARAPRAGGSVMLPLQSVLPVVERAGLDWDRDRAPDYIMVERSSDRPRLSLARSEKQAPKKPTPAAKQPTGTVPVLKHPMARGETITDSDVEFVPTPRRLGGNILTRADRVIGMAAKRSLRAGEPLRRSDLERPVMVRKGSLVAMETRRGPLSVTTIGKALADGAMGDIIPLANARSNRTVEARVVGADRVSPITLDSSQIALNR